MRTVNIIASKILTPAVEETLVYNTNVAKDLLAKNMFKKLADEWRKQKYLKLSYESIDWFKLALKNYLNAKNNKNISACLHTDILNRLLAEIIKCETQEIEEPDAEFYIEFEE